MPRLVRAQLRTRIERTRVPERNYFETKLVSGREFRIIKCAEFGVERTYRCPKKMKLKSSTNVTRVEPELQRIKQKFQQENVNKFRRYQNFW